MFKSFYYFKFKLPISVTRYTWALLLLLCSAANANLLENGTFDGDGLPWEGPGWWAGGAGSTGVDEDGRYCIAVEVEGTETWGAQLRQGNLSFSQGESYRVSFRAWSTAPVVIDLSATDETSGFVWLFGTNVGVDAPLDSEGQFIDLDFNAAESSETALFRFLVGGGLVPAGETLCIDDVVVEPPSVNLLTNSDFEEGTLLPWEVGFWNDSAGSAAVDNGRACLLVDNPGGTDWSVQFRESDLSFVADREYAFSADVWSSSPASINASGVDESVGFNYHFGENFDIDAPLDGPAQQISANFMNVGGDTEQGKFRFMLGAGLVAPGTTLCFDNIQLLDPQGEAEEEEQPHPYPIFVNQHGYLPALSKYATYALRAEANLPESPRTWQLSLGGEVVAVGETTYLGLDMGSDDLTHLIDFSEVDVEGELYQFSIVEDAGLESEAVVTSQLFSVGASLYSQFKYDVLDFFYQNRSGIEIEAGLVGDLWARPAGHTGDVSVETIECLTDPSSDLCRVLDSSGGWYDAGDHGKYVVNAGISVWTLMNQYERARYLGGNLSQFSDGSMSLPVSENNNGIPDILDEVRWELEWMLKMQVPADLPLAGLVHHKMHGEFWTGIPTLPHADPATRYAHPPSTIATLNLAAAGAQCYRVFKDFDSAFADQCLQQAEQAYSAAKSADFIPATNNGNGGGTYGDGNPNDEFYWAAAELFLATGAPQYANDMASAADMHLSLDSVAYGQSIVGWPTTHGLGVMSLATSGLAFNAPENWVEQSRQEIVKVADLYVAHTYSQAYGLPMQSEQVYWGSNSNVANNMIVLGLAQDFSCDEEYAGAMQSSMSYLLGRNPLGQSYVSGYGSLSMVNPHHRFWAASVNVAFPPPPAGVLAGGPNGLLQDPLVQGRLLGCSPLECYLDHVESYSTNEVAINWNAPLAWAAGYMDELGDSEQKHISQQRCMQRNQHFSGFEDPDRQWTISGSSSLESSTDKSRGDSGLSVSGCGYMPIVSPKFSTSEFDIVGDELSLDIKLPTEQENPLWLGDAQVLISFADAGIFNAWLGIDFMDEDALGNWSTLSFTVPEEIQAAFVKDQAASITLALNTENCQAPLLIDNLRFTGNTKER